MYQLSLQYILDGTEARVVGKIPGDPRHIIIRELAFDSRKILDGKDGLFMAFITESGDGHRYWREAYKKGIRYFLVSQIPGENLPDDAIFLLTADTLVALQNLARIHRQNFQGKILAITGSSAKTTIKEWLSYLISPEVSLSATPGSYNSALGIPLSLLLMNNRHDWAIIEAGISAPGEMDKAEKLIKPEYGILTNIGSAHSENFPNQEGILEEKKQLFKNSSYWICRSEPEWIRKHIENSPRGASVLFWGVKPAIHNHWQVSVYKNGNGTSDIHIQSIDQSNTTIRIPFEDEASIENAIHCAVFCLKENLLTPGVLNRFASLRPVDMRLQIEAGVNRCTLLADIYTADVASLRTALQALNLLPGFKKRTLILTDLRLHGKPAEEVYREAGMLVTDAGTQKNILIGKRIGEFAQFFPTDSFCYPSTEEFLARFPFSLLQEEAILVKGIREHSPVKIVDYLEQKSHETRLEINLDSLTHNLNHFKRSLGPEVKIMAMVKAFSYGSGSIETANHLRYNNIDYLAVAYTDEGAELRRAGIDLPILVMNAGLPSVSMLLEHRLEPEIFSFRSLEYLAEELMRRKPDHELKVHLKVDTGMHRLGFAPDEVETACRKICSLPGMKLASVFSHLASAEDPKDDDFTRKQIETFSKSAEIASRICGYPVLRHLANSAGVQRFSEARFDMVRLGIAMYGISPSPHEKDRLRPVLRFKTVISQIRKLESGESVGYNRASVLTRDSLIATIPVGYADGFRRNLGLGKAHVWINGKLYPTVGKVCMDMTMIDVTGGNVKEGDEVILFGPEWGVEEMASAAGTIPYEILTGISPRVKRVYLKE